MLRKLLSPPVVPPNGTGTILSNDISDTSAYQGVGIVSNPTLEDLSEIMPDVAQSLREVLKYKGNVEEDLMLTFQVTWSHITTSILKHVLHGSTL